MARSLDTALAGRELAVGRLRVPAHATADLAGWRVLGTATHGKHLLTRLARGGETPLTLHTHLRMDGQWALLDPGRRLPSRLVPDVRAVLVTAQDPAAPGGGRTAAALRMPVVELLPTAREHDVVGHLGPDLLAPDFDAAEAVRRLGSDPQRPLAAALLDQRLVAGLGNLWANELCFLIGRSPWTPVGEVDLPRLVALAARALRASAAGTTGYQVTTGNTRRGEDHWVAGRAGKPCRRCGTSVRMVEEVPGDPGRRRTWWCPHCQPGPGPDR
ncbi:DNA-formamidopyrimidine glycosylase family protein [Quadrisphaera sp. DSM 44207]|uniref:DNA-formamidopyrimidine glycosylase family protein n=1 Tax=Quadrisphaera sp. DSM 44207 TaxID=1881057 RepID=UPI001C40AA4E